MGGERIKRKGGGCEGEWESGREGIEKGSCRRDRGQRWGMGWVPESSGDMVVCQRWVREEGEEGWGKVIEIGKGGV